MTAPILPSIRAPHYWLANGTETVLPPCVLIADHATEHPALSTLIRVSTRLHRPSHDERRAVLGDVKALAALDPAGFGLDGASAQLEAAIM
jgi:hypothetical protein